MGIENWNAMGFLVSQKWCGRNIESRRKFIILLPHTLFSPWVWEATLQSRLFIHFFCFIFYFLPSLSLSSFPLLPSPFFFLPMLFVPCPNLEPKIVHVHAVALCTFSWIIATTILFEVNHATALHILNSQPSITEYICF